MKNILILGIPRAGKSTLSKMIAKKYNNYITIDTDSIRDAFQHALPSTKINKYNGKGMKDDFPKFIEQLLYWESYNNQEYNYIIDSADISPLKAKELFNNDKNIIIFLGFLNITVEEVFENCRKYDKENSWSKKVPDKELKEILKRYVDRSKELYIECKKYNFKFFDTAFNREKVLNEIILYIEEKIGESL